MKHTLPELPYAYDALEPYIDTQTMEIHHNRHHQTYIDKLNAALEPHQNLKDVDIQTLLRNLEELPEDIRTAVRNHGGGHANHSFFWPLLKKGVPFTGPVADLVVRHFGSFEVFKKHFANASTLIFGSGWAWLVIGDNGMEIITTANQDSPLSFGKVPLIGIDVWEHAYYLKYQNRRPDYVEAFFSVINWERVNDTFGSIHR